MIPLGQVLRAFVDIGYHLILSYLDIGIFLLFLGLFGYLLDYCSRTLDITPPLWIFLGRCCSPQLVHATPN